MKRTEAIYARQSVDKKDSISIETQIEKCELIATGETKIYDDKGYSGKNTSRPKLGDLIKDIEAGKISRVIVYRLDRISRNITDFYNLYSIMQKHGTDFVSVNENFDTSTPMGRAMMGILIVFAQMERESIQERVKDNYYSRISMDGRWAGGPAPYGFTNGKTEDKKPTLKVNADEMEIVKYCFNQYAYSPNISMNQICKALTEKGYKSRRKNGGWDNVTIARMLQNSVYAVADERLKKYYEIRKVKFLNDCEWDGSTSAHIVGKKVGNVNTRKYTDLKEQSIYLTNFKGLIDSKTFIMVQERLENNEQISRSNAPSVLEELAGLIKCKKCGYAIKSHSKSAKGIPYLGCHGRYTLKTCDVSLKGVRFPDLQNQVGNEVQKELDKIAQSIVTEIISDKEKENHIKELKSKIDNLLELVALGGESAKTVHSKIETLQQEINEIQLTEFMNTKATERLRISDRLPIVYDRLSTDEKKSICQQMIEKILLSSNGDMEIVWKI